MYWKGGLLEGGGGSFKAHWKPKTGPLFFAEMKYSAILPCQKHMIV